jgi:hypothetical protein
MERESGDDSAPVMAPTPNALTAKNGMCKKIVRILAWFLAAVLASILLLAAAIRVDQYVLRYRAERLQSDIRSLELRKSTFADARRLEGRWFDNTKEKVCRPFRAWGSRPFRRPAPVLPCRYTPECSSVCHFER